MDKNEDVEIEYWCNGNKRSEVHYNCNGKEEGLATGWYETGEKWFEEHWNKSEEISPEILKIIKKQSLSSAFLILKII